MKLPSGDTVTIWAARDLEKLVVKIEHAKKDRNDESQPFTTTELLDVRIGADPDDFEQPKGYTVVKSYAELMRSLSRASLESLTAKSRRSRSALSSSGSFAALRMTG